MMKFRRLTPISTLFYCIVPGLLISISACKKNNSLPPGSLTAKTGDSTYSGVGVEGTISPAKQFSITSTGANKTTTVELTFSEPFQLNQPFSSGVFARYSVGYAPFIYQVYGLGQGHTSVSVTNWDSVSRHVAGSFSGVLYSGPYDSTYISNGTFDVYCKAVQ